MRRNDDHIDKLFEMLRWAHAQDEKIDLDSTFPDRVCAQLTPYAPVPLERLSEMLRRAQNDTGQTPLESSAEEARFTSNVLRAIKSDAESDAAESFAGWLEHYTNRALGVAAPLAAVLAVWFLVVGVTPDVELRTVIEAGF